MFAPLRVPSPAARLLLLTTRTIEARTLPDDGRADRRRAFEARLALAIVHAQLTGEAAGLALRVAIAAKGGAATADRLAQNLRRNRGDTLEFGAGHATSAPGRPHARPKQDL